MPRYWYDRHANTLHEDHTEADVARRDLNARIVADKKPYFMRYIYPTLMSQYNTYIQNTRTKCLREFRVEPADLLAIPEEDRSEEQQTFIRHYLRRMPVGMNNCVMNRICRIFEREFDGYLKLNYSGRKFDTNIIKSGVSYTARQYTAIAKLYAQHTERIKEQISEKRQVREVLGEDAGWRNDNLQRVFQEECLKVCSNEALLCDLVIDLCYRRAGTQQFAWDVCGSQIVKNLLQKHDFLISYPVQDAGGDFVYGGQCFKMIRKRSMYDGNHFERESVGGECDRERESGTETGRDADARSEVLSQHGVQAE